MSNFHKGYRAVPVTDNVELDNVSGSTIPPPAAIDNVESASVSGSTSPPVAADNVESANVSDSTIPPMTTADRPDLQEPQDEPHNGTPTNGHTNGHEQDQMPQTFSHKLGQLGWKMVYWTSILLLTVFIFAWAYEILLAEIPRFAPVVASGSKGNVVITVLAQVFVQLVDSLLTSSFELLGYHLASRSEGVSIPTFLQLIPATSYFGSLSLTTTYGGHLIWTTQRLIILPVLGIALGSILKYQADFVYQFIPISDTVEQVYGGQEPMDISVLSYVHTTEVCIYFSAFVSSLLGVSQFVTAKSPVYCVENCTSIFLPGGVELLRKFGGNLNQTLLQENTFGNSDTIVVNRAPGIGIEFWQPDPGFQFDHENECKTYPGYNQTDGDAIQLCIAPYKSYLAVGWTVCPGNVSDVKSCVNDTSWSTASIGDQTVLAVYRQNATVAYSRQNLSILHVDFVSSPYTYPISASEFLTIWDKLLDPAQVHQPSDSMMQNSVLFQLTWYLRLYQDRYKYDNQPLAYLRNFITIPLQFGTTALQMANATLTANNFTNLIPIPADLEVTASGAQIITRFKGKVWTFCIFAAIGGSLILYSGLILGWILFQRPALLFNPSGFPVFDFALLSDSPVRRTQRSIAQLAQTDMPGNPSTCRISSRVRQKRLRLEGNPRDVVTLTEHTEVDQRRRTNEDEEPDEDLASKSSG